MGKLVILIGILAGCVDSRTVNQWQQQYAECIVKHSNIPNPSAVCKAKLCPSKPYVDVDFFSNTVCEEYGR